MKKLKSTSFETLAVHAGERAQKSDATPTVSPIWPAVTYIYDSMDDMDAVFEGTKSGPLYLRYSNPTVVAFETAVAALEGAEAAQAYSSGMAAIHSTLLAAGARSGASVVAALDVYGATFAILNRVLTTLGVNVRMVDATRHEEVEKAMRETGATILLVETISNPLLKVADIPTLAEMAHRNGAVLLVDNTFASPYLFRPLQHGADYAIHSATKYLSGHGDVLAGVVATSEENRHKLNELNKLTGSVLGPFEAWLAMRGLKTLPLRVQRQFASAQKIADWLCKQPRIARVNYPGLEMHPQHALAGRLFEGKGYGGVLSFEIKGADKAMVFRFMEHLNVCVPATTLGDVYTLVLHPATASHRALTAEERKRVGIPDGLVRLSAGIEAVEDVVADLEEALASLA